uniref:Uncharacterized protein n=2 Tax=Anguilla anguilla TaxID=7936 RepID=A0A0E9S531_ANGAN
MLETTKHFGHFSVHHDNHIQYKHAHRCMSMEKYISSLLEGLFPIITPAPKLDVGQNIIFNCGWAIPQNFSPLIILTHLMNYKVDCSEDLKSIIFMLPLVFCIH